MEIQGFVDNITFRNADNGYSILRVRSDGQPEPVTMVGVFAPMQVGECFEFVGQWVKHQSYGPQFKVERAVPIRPRTANGIKKYLASGLIDGIGAATAQRIVEQFALETFAILDENPHRLREVTTIGKKKAKRIISAWRENKAQQDVQMFCIGHGISPNMMQRVIQRYGAEAIAAIAENPYRLAQDIRGIGFLKADEIARSVGIAPDSEHRIYAAIHYVIEQSQDRGHCYLTHAQLLHDLIQLLQIPSEAVTGQITPLLATLNERGFVISERLENDDSGPTEAHYLPEIFSAEQAVATKLAALLAKPFHADTERIDEWLSRYNDAAQTELSPTQIQAVKMAASKRVFVMTGGPGVGKTTTANAIIRLLKAMNRSVALAAPTGRAAQRLMQVSAVKAQTIHRLLEWTQTGFDRNEERPLEAQAIIIDETSMLDIRLMAAVMAAVPLTSQIILIGDVDQLPAIGPGSVLRDLIQSGVVPCVRLTEIFRQAQSSRIILAAHAINAGERPVFVNSPSSDCHFLEHQETTDIRAALESLVTTEIPEAYGLDPLRDIQVLTPMNRGDLGTQILNADLQTRLNPLGPNNFEFKTPAGVFRVGDKVIQCANNYELGVFNGDIGLVLHAAVNGEKVIVVFGDRQINYSGEQLKDLRLAYAITIHKAQGSEFPAVVIPISTAHFIMLQRNLIYTALTRAKRLAVFVGSQRAMLIAVRNQSSAARQSRLIERIIAELQ